MYENKKYKILNIRDTPGPNFEVVVQWLVPIEKIEHIFMNDMYLEETMLIQRLDDMWEQVYNRGPEQIADKKAKIIELANKLKKEV
jgi:hypothetical protein